MGLQEKLNSLKIKYETKRATLINKLNTQQKYIEEIYKVYYDTLDEMRNDMLGEEYKLRKRIAEFETQTRKFTSNMENYSIYEFYTDQAGLEEQI